MDSQSIIPLNRSLTSLTFVYDIAFMIQTIFDSKQRVLTSYQRAVKKATAGEWMLFDNLCKQ